MPVVDLDPCPFNAPSAVSRLLRLCYEMRSESMKSAMQ